MHIGKAVGKFPGEFLKPCLGFLKVGVLGNRKLLQAFRVFFFRELLVEKTVGLVPKPDAPETITAPETVLTKLTLSAVGTVLRVIHHVTVRTIDAFCTPFAADAKRKTAAADALAGVASVVHIFRVENAEAVVAILGSDCLRKITIFGTILDEVVPRFT